MSDGMGILEAKNNFSALIQGIESGEKDRIVITRYGKPVADIVPHQDEPDTRKRIGLFKDVGPEIDWDVFDALDGEIADSLGA